MYLINKFKFYFCLLMSLISTYSLTLNTTNKYEELQVEIVQPNSIHCSIKFFFDGTNQLLTEQHPITGLNYLLDSVSSFFTVCSEKNDIDNDIKNQINELVIKLKYQLTVLINTYFKLYKFSKSFSLNIEQKKKISQNIKFMFRNLLTIPLCPTNMGNCFNEYIIKILETIYGIFSPTSVTQEVLDSNKHIFNEVNQIFNSLKEKCSLITIKKSGCYNVDSNILNGLYSIFDNMVDLAIKFDINFENLNDITSGLLKIIVTSFSDDESAK